MTDVRFCPWCGTDLRGRALTEEERASGAWGRDTTHFWRTIGAEVPGVYDGILFWRCPDCWGSWHRFPEGNPCRARAERFVGPPPALREAVSQWVESRRDEILAAQDVPGVPDDPEEIRRRLVELRAAKSVRSTSTEGST